MLYHLGNSKDFMSSVPGTVDKLQVCFLYHPGKRLKSLETSAELNLFLQFQHEPKPCPWSYEA